MRRRPVSLWSKFASRAISLVWTLHPRRGHVQQKRRTEAQGEEEPGEGEGAARPGQGPRESRAVATRARVQARREALPGRAEELLSLELVNPIALGGGVALALFLAILASLALGRHLGKRTIARTGDKPNTGIGSLEAAVFALLGLLIAFTFSGALQRFDSRRVTVVDEANAIGTAWLRIDLLPAAAQPKLRDAVRAYTDSRIATYRALPDIAAARAELERSRALQNEIWAQALAALRGEKAGLAAELLVLPALNDMFNFTTVRAASTLIHPPGIIYWMLIALGVAAAVLAGYQTSGEKDYDWPHKIGFAAMVALTVYVIFDIEYPRLGLVRIDAIDRILVEVREGMR
jgi:hypothetical protein